MRRIKFAMVAATGLVAFASGASGADLSVFTPMQRGPVADVWTGFYVGLNAGETFENHNSVDTVSVPTYHNTAVPNSAYWADNSAAGASGRTGIESRGHFIGGAQIGYNLQFNRNIIAGAEADIQALGGAGRGTSTNTRSLPLFGLYNTNNSPVADTMTTTISASKKLEYFGTLRARLGILATPILFLYGTGGLAYGRVRASTSILQTNTDQANKCNGSFSPSTIADCIAGSYENPTATSSGSVSRTRIGGTAGAGVEWIVSRMWRAKVEYLYYDLGTITYGLSPLVTTNNVTVTGASQTSIVSSKSTTHFSGSIVRAGINYAFGSPVGLGY